MHTSGVNEGEGRETWQNSDGDRLEDYGVDEEADLYDEDNVPLAEVLRRRRQMTSASNDAIQS